MNGSTKQILRAALSGDPEISPAQRAAVFSVLSGETRIDSGAVLLSQAQKAQQLQVSRFTIRRMVSEKLLTPVVLPLGKHRPLIRYRADEIPGAMP